MAGLSVDAFNRIVDLGILTPHDGDVFTDGQARGAEFVASLEAAGLSLDDMAVLFRSRAMSLDFMERPEYSVFTGLSDVTFAELAARSGVPVSILMLIREAGGAAQPGPDDRVRQGELAVVPFLEYQVNAGFPQIAIERLLRAYGDSLRRMAESEAEWWRAGVIAPLTAAGKSGAELMDVEPPPAVDDSVIALWHAHRARAWTGNIVESIEGLLAEAGLGHALRRPPAMCFLDIAGYTRLTAEQGDAAAASLAERLGRLVHRVSASHGGKPVKWLGDGVLLYFRDPGSGVVAALDMVDLVVEAGLPPAHVGLHAGPVVFQQGDYYGQTVNVASRIAEYARPGEVLVSQAVVDAADGVAATFREIGPVELRGVASMVTLHAAIRS